VSINQTPIPSSIQKLLRAKRLHEELEILYYTYLQSKPYDLVATADPSVPGYRVTTNHTPPPMEMALVFGDFVHNLRSALDHHARALVIDSGGIPNDGPGGTMFPVLDTKPQKPLALKAKSGGPSLTDVGLIESVQPYNSPVPKQHPLSQLSLLDNIDKHRHLNVISMAGSANIAFFPADKQDIVISEETPMYVVSSAATEDQIVQVAEPLIDGPVVARGTHVSHVVLDEPSVYAAPTNILQVCGELHEYVATKVFDLWFK
jgi:hypothetical protein